MPKKKDKKNNEFDLNKFIEKELRRAFKRSPLYSEAKNRAKREFFVESKKGKPLRRVHYQCAGCGRFFLDKSVDRCKEIAIDHKEPVISLEHGRQDNNTYIERLFCSVDNLQVLCNYKGERDGVRSCHKIKTQKEREEAAKYRKDKK